MKMVAKEGGRSMKMVANQGGRYLIKVERREVVVLVRSDSLRKRRNPNVVRGDEFRREKPRVGSREPEIENRIIIFHM